MDGIPRFVSSESYTRSFGFQWRLHRTTQLDADPSGSSAQFLRSLGLTPDAVKDRLILDAGCGAGRYSDVLLRWGGKVVAMDLSLAVEACYENAQGKDAIVIQGDILSPPLAPEAFDIILSIGVLHHTPDPKAAFRSLCGLLKPGGYIAIWVYHAYHDDTLRVKLSKFYRRFTRRMPPRLLYVLCYGAVPWYYLNRVPLLRTVTGRIWHISDHPWWRWRVLDTFDWYSSYYQSHHTYAEVFQWFRENGLVDIQIFDPPVAIGGYRALSG